MKKDSTTKIERYKDGDWYIDVIENNDPERTKSKPEKAKYEAWLSNKYYGISIMMFGANFPKKEIMDWITSQLEDFKNYYIEKYFDEPPFDM